MPDRCASKTASFRRLYCSRLASFLGLEDERWTTIYNPARAHTYVRPTHTEGNHRLSKHFGHSSNSSTFSTLDRIRYRVLVTRMTFTVLPEDSAVNDVLVRRPLLERTCEDLNSFKVEFVRLLDPQELRPRMSSSMRHQCATMDSTGGMCAPMLQCSNAAEGPRTCPQLEADRASRFVGPFLPERQLQFRDGYPLPTLATRMRFAGEEETHHCAIERAERLNNGAEMLLFAHFFR